MKKVIKLVTITLSVCALCALSYYIGGHDIYIDASHTLRSNSYEEYEYEAEEDAYFFYHILDQVRTANPEIWEGVIQEAPAYEDLFRERFPYAHHWSEIQDAMEE